MSNEEGEEGADDFERIEKDDGNDTDGKNNKNGRMVAIRTRVRRSIHLATCAYRIYSVTVAVCQVYRFVSCYT